MYSRIELGDGKAPALLCKRIGGGGRGCEEDYQQSYDVVEEEDRWWRKTTGVDGGAPALMVIDEGKK